MTGEKTTELFGAAEALKLQQLQLRKWMAERQVEGNPVQDTDPQDLPQDANYISQNHWQLLEDLTLYPWQKEGLEAWLETGGRGIAKVVTGAGKTVLAFAAMQSLRDRFGTGVKVAIVVPTMVLQDQWYKELINKKGMSAENVGRSGGGHKDSLDDKKEIIVYVLHTAVKVLMEDSDKLDENSDLLLIVDECHRSGAPKMASIFQTNRKWTLGLSATPERNGDDDLDIDESETELLFREIGPICYELSLNQALKTGLVPTFEINHMGVPLTGNERNRYEAATRQISKLKKTLPKTGLSGGGMFASLQKLAKSGGENSRSAARILSLFSTRKEILVKADARGSIVESILKKEFEKNPDARAIVFHESIEEVMKLFRRLETRGHKVIAEHSGLPQKIRNEGIELFRKGDANIIVSARSLIEGFNVPAADIGIIAASSKSVRQRVQTLGRVLRRKSAKATKQIQSSVFVLYAADTTEEEMYEKVDWEEITGSQQNRYFRVDNEMEARETPAPPRQTIPGEEDIEGNNLKPGDEYPGRYSGNEFRCDNADNIFLTSDNTLARLSPDLPGQIEKIKKTRGKFRVTPKKGFVLVRVPVDEEWTTLFVTTIENEKTANLEIEEGTGRENNQDSSNTKTLITGDRYANQSPVISDDSIAFTQKRGGLLQRKIPNGKIYARNTETARDRIKGENAERLISAIQQEVAKGVKITRLLKIENNDVLYLSGGVYYYLVNVSGGLEFPDPERGMQ